MKQTALFLAIALTLSTAACGEQGTSTDTTTGDTTAVAPSPALASSIDRQLEDVDQDLSDLETRLQSAPAEVKEEVEGEMENLREDRREIDSLRADMDQLTDPEAARERQSDVWEKVRDLDIAVTEARFEVADEQAEFTEVGNQEVQELDDEISRLEADSANVAPELREERRERLAELRDEREELRNSWEKVENATESTWEQAKQEVVQAWNKVRRSVAGIEVPDIDVEANPTEDGNSSAS